MNSFEIKEKEWIDLELSHDDFDYPRVEMSLSFDAEHLKIKAVVHDTHFKDGDRSWRYGDGFLINFITETYPNNKESGKFYAYGFSVIAGARLTTLVNHNGTYFLTSLEHKPEIKLDLENRRAYYTVDLPWHMLKPFHPLLHKIMGINIRYNSQNDDGSKKMLQLLEDEHFDSESKVEKQYIPVHFSLSEKSELQFAFEMEDNLVQKEEVQTRIIIYSEADLDTTIRMVLRDPDGKIAYKFEKEIELEAGLNQLEAPLTTPDKTSLYSLRLILDDRLEKELELYRLSSDEVSNLEKRVEEFGRNAREAHEISSYYGLAYKLNELVEQVKEFDSKGSPKTIEQSVRTIRALLDRCDSYNHIYTEAGYVRTAFLSQTDETIQPYSIYLPENFDLNQQYKLLVALHGSGVDEVGFLKYVGQRFADFGYVAASPRGRDLSDWYIGQTENDVRDMIDVLKEMFNIEKTLIFGFSMGGYGVWRLTFLFPALFEGAIVGSGVIRSFEDDEHPAKDVRPLRKGAKHIPYLVMHGTEDRAVPFKNTKEFVETLNEEGFDVTFEVYEGAGHGDYDPSEAIQNWLMRVAP